MALDIFCLMVSLAMPVAHLLSNWRGVGPCGSEFFEGLAEWEKVFGGEEARTCFGFLDRGHDRVDQLRGRDCYGAVVSCRGGVAVLGGC